MDENSPGNTPAGVLRRALHVVLMTDRCNPVWPEATDALVALDALVAERDDARIWLAIAEESRERWVEWHREKCEQLDADALVWDKALRDACASTVAAVAEREEARAAIATAIDELEGMFGSKTAAMLTLRAALAAVSAPAEETNA